MMSSGLNSCIFCHSPLSTGLLHPTSLKDRVCVKCMTQSRVAKETAEQEAAGSGAEEDM